ncbi:MAG: HD domain-containing protein [Ruminococcus sp.]|nr:HD domain-containing protein [Ruminococcus sp.]
MPNEELKAFSKTRVGETLTRPVFIKAIEERPTKNGDLYLTFTLLDGEGECSANYFSTNAAQQQERGITAGIVAEVTVTVRDYKGGKSFNIDSIAPYTGDEFTVGDFIVTPPIDVNVMYDDMIASLHACGDDRGGTAKPLSDLAVMILEKYKAEFLHSSAAVSMHHNFKGGLIYHSYRIVKAADAICDVYPELDRELLMSAAAIHDIGKIWEYSTDAIGSSEVTGSGVLFGHIYMGAKLVSGFADRYYAENKDAPRFVDEKVRLLTHMILSHHGVREWGAVATPAIPEAFALHYLDSIDAKINSCEKEFSKLRPGEITKKTPFGFDGKMYKPAYKEKAGDNK